MKDFDEDTSELEKITADFEHWKEKKVYGNALNIAEEHLPERIREVAEPYFDFWIEQKSYGNALMVAEKHLPERIREAAQVYFDFWMKQEAYGNALMVAEKHLPEKVREAAQVYFDFWIEQKSYGNALDIAKKHLPEREKEMAILTIESNVAAYESSLMGSDPNSGDGNDKANLIIANMILEQVRGLASSYLDENGILFVNKGDDVEMKQVELETRISDIQKNAKERLADPILYQLKQDLKVAIKKEEYEVATELRNKIKDLGAL